MRSERIVVGLDEAALTAWFPAAEFVITSTDAPGSDLIVVALGPDGLSDPIRADCPVIGVASQIDRSLTQRMLSAGVSGVVSRNDPAMLPAAARAVAAGFIVVPVNARQALVRPTFTAREKQILGLVVLGSRNREIADRLFISEATVKMHMTNVMRKLGVRSRREAVDLILDPDAGLGAGILTIAAGTGVQSHYGSPDVYS
jgi:DNA-binding NarL/FixJ family response regulator